MSIRKSDIKRRAFQRARGRWSSYMYYNFGYDSAYADDVIEAFLEEIIEAVKNGETVTITGFGTFSPRQYSARMGTHPQTGAAIQINARRAPGFRPGEIFKRRVR